MSKILIAYFSATGVTAKLAQTLAQQTEADLYEIKPEKPYSQQDLNWVNPLSRTMREYVGKSKVPVEGKCDSMAEYDTVILGFPIWFFKQPNVILSFLSQYDFKGKTMSFFATSHKAGIEKATADLKKNCLDANWKEGILANGKSSDELKSWLCAI